MKNLFNSLSALLLSFTLLVPTSARAQYTVIDPANLVENITSVSYALEQINNQIQQLENDAQMLRNEGRQLTSLDYNALTQLRVTLATTSRLLQEAQGIGFTVSGTDATFNRLYPNTYSAAISGEKMQTDALERWQNARNATHTAMRLQAQAAQNMTDDEQALAQLVEQSQSAVGQLQAAQATNQLLALQSRQAMQDQQLRLTQDRAVSLEQARALEAAEHSREVRRRFLGEGTRYSPLPVSFYP